MTIAVLLPYFNYVNPPYAGAVVTVKKASDDSEADLFDAPSGGSALVNPQTLTARGMLLQPVYVDEPVYCSIDGVHVADHDTGIFHPPYYAAISGATGSRPTLAATDIGFEYFDTTLGTPIWWDGAAWVDATGAGA